MLNPNHVAGNLDHDCTKCHGTTAWKPATFDHATTLFPLTGAHQATPCQSCHTNGNYNLTYTGCYQCHQNDFAQVLNPNHISANLDHDCTKCHTTTAWKPATFDHAATLFPLTGAHQATPCQSCHTNGNYNLTYTGCYQCHQNDFAQVLNPNHISANLDHDCTKCHTTTAWKPATFDHAATLFPLTGAHQATPCQSCHTNGNYNLTYTGCYQCHETDYTSATNPNHVAGNFSKNCTVCHSSASWIPSQLDHSKTALPLTGKHATIQCEQCHTGGNYTIVFTDCKQCHTADFQNAKNPDHAAGQFSNDCSQCHTTAGWKPSTFDHGATNFPLVGAHLATPCNQCHTNGNYNLVYNNCLQCHQKDYDNTQSPSHTAGRFGSDCLQCHTMNAWKPSTFNHASTQFPLTGAHQTAQCQECHTNGNYNLTNTGCYQCHQNDFTQTLNPNHVAANLDHDCTKCHTTTAWKPSTFDHAGTKFPLEGAHQAQPCQACHVNGNYHLSYTDCWQCHESDFNGATNPNHAAGGFGHDCTVCHQLNAWSPATFDHAATGFPLQGAHSQAQCQACHMNGNYQLTYQNCYQCHQSDYSGALTPNHSANLFPQDCSVCHTQTAWQPSTFEHSNTQFALTGAHQTRPCLDCHTGGNYQIVYTDCYQCHQSDYTTAVNPNHATNQFSHNCLSCHTTSAWKPSTFNHANTNFPLQGAHTTKPCASCHINGNYNLTYVDCYQCHQSDFNGATSPANHTALNLSHDCTQCHTQTTWTGATPFYTMHNVNAPNGFPISGGGAKHRRPGEWNNCSDCHTTNNTATFCCTSCHEHSNQGSVNGDHSGVPGYSYSCTSCAAAGCHPDGREP